MWRGFFAFTLLFLVACQGQQAGNGIPDELVVVTRNAPTTWYQGRDGAEGLEYDLIKAFSESLGIGFRFVTVDSIGEALEAMADGDAHIAAAGLTDTERRREQGLLFGPQYYTVQQQVVCRRKHGGIPDNIEELVGREIEVIADSSYVERLQELKQQFPQLTWKEVDEVGTEQLLEKVWNRQIDCTIADSNIVSINRRYYPELVIAFAISEEQPLAWVVNQQWPELIEAIENWLEDYQQSGNYSVVIDKYYGHVELFDYVDMRKFISRIKSRLPDYIDLFKQAADQQQLDWSLLAAQSYQESHWNPKAKSPTGVRGLMMLTLNTAKQMGVESRLNAVQSVEGGAKYLAHLLQRVPDSVQGEDRLWFALAAYNVGFGHLRDARSLAAELGKSPDHWVDLKQVLPLLSQKKYYKTLKYGYARGSEPVRYVQRIRDYQQVLLKTLKSKE